MKSIEERLAEIEQRLAVLEGKGRGAPGHTAEPLDVAPAAKPGDPKIRLKISNKRYAPSNSNAGSYEDYIWFDCTYTLSADSRPTRAVKGLLEFADLFGDVQFRLNVTVNDPLTPGKALEQAGIGFTYNQFIGEHQWMMATALQDMKVAFKPLSIIYTDGTSESVT